MSTVKLQINTKDHKYPIFIGSGLINKLSKLLKSCSIKFTKCLLVIDNKVPKIFLKKININNFEIPHINTSPKKRKISDEELKAIKFYNDYDIKLFNQIET